MNTRTDSPPPIGKACESESLNFDPGANNAEALPPQAERPVATPGEIIADERAQAVKQRGQSYRRRTATIWLLGPLAVLLGARILTHGNGREVQIPGLGWSLPETCGLRLQFGLDCPGCGLTRSFIHLAHGEWHQAWQLHWMGGLLFLYTLAQIPLAIAYAWQPANNAKSSRAWRCVVYLNERLLLGLLALLAIRWIYKLLNGDLL